MNPKILTGQLNPMPNLESEQMFAEMYSQVIERGSMHPVMREVEFCSIDWNMKNIKENFCWLRLKLICKYSILLFIQASSQFTQFSNNKQNKDVFHWRFYFTHSINTQIKISKHLETTFEILRKNKDFWG